MNNWKTRLLTAVFLGAFLASPLVAGEEEKREASAEPRYQSPVVSLLLLPVTVLIKMASVFEPEKKKSGGGASSAEDRD